MLVKTNCEATRTLFSRHFGASKSALTKAQLLMHGFGFRCLGPLCSLLFLEVFFSCLFHGFSVFFHGFSVVLRHLAWNEVFVPFSLLFSWLSKSFWARSTHPCPRKVFLSEGFLSRFWRLLREGSLEGVLQSLQWVSQGGRVLRRDLRRGSKKGLRRKCLNGGTRLCGGYCDPLRVRPAHLHPTGEENGSNLTS